jgi:hypothetical protein
MTNVFQPTMSSPFSRASSDPIDVVENSQPGHVFMRFSHANAQPAPMSHAHRV